MKDFLAREILLPHPDNPSEWGHLYLCSRCQTKLAFNRDSPHSHVCPSCGNVERGVIFDRCWNTFCHTYQGKSALSAALLGVIDDNKEAMDYALKVISGYALVYGAQVEHGIAAGTGRVQSQSLDEAVWLINICHTWRILKYSGHMTPIESDLICEKLFSPAIKLLKRQTWEVHNIHIWHASAIAAAAIACGDEISLHFAERIISRGMEYGVQPGGMWYEISILYHYYTLDALLCYETACLESGRKGVAGDIIPLMLKAPLDLALPSGQFPLINDGWPENRILEKSGHYERAQALFGNMDQTLAYFVRNHHYIRDNRDAFLSGKDEITDSSFSHSPLTVTDGLITIRRLGLTSVIKASPDGGGHDHPDRLSLNIYPDNSNFRAAEAGNPGYGSPYHEGFFRKTCAHNTIMIDGKDQRRCGARIRRVLDLDEVAYVHLIENNGAYDNVGIERKTIAGDGWIIDITEIKAQMSRKIQWFFYGDGALKNSKGDTSSGKEAELVANDFMEEQKIISRHGWNGFWEMDTFHFYVDLEFQGENGNIGCAITPGLPSEKRRECLIVTNQGREMRVTALFSIEGAILPTRINSDSDSFTYVLPSGKLLHENECGSVTLENI